MQRIIDGVAYERKYHSSQWDVRIFEARGHRETSVRPATYWEEIGPVGTLPDWLQPEPNPERDAADAEEHRQLMLQKAARRAKTLLRRVIKAEGFDELLTLTYKANQEDRALCKKHFKEWVRRMKRAIPGFRYAGSFEKQKRGAMHVHLCTHKLPPSALYKGVKIKAWEVGTRIWRDIVGDLGGMCFVGGRTKWGGARRNMSGAKMAAYVSKYILKDFADAPEESNRYSRSDGSPDFKVQSYRFEGTHLDMIELVFDVPPGHVVVSEGVGRFADGYWLCTEPERPQPLSLEAAAVSAAERQAAKWAALVEGAKRFPH